MSDHDRPARPYLFCGCCGCLVPDDSGAWRVPDPATATACGQCGGPAAPGGLTVPQYERYGRAADPVDWPLCDLCAVVGRGAHSDAATLADVLATRAPAAASAQLALLAFSLASEKPADTAAYPETGWASFARRIGGLGPYCQVRPEAYLGGRAGERWWHIPPALVYAIAADLERVRAAREPVADSTGRPCSVCGAESGPPRRWTVDALRHEPVCGLCSDRALGRPAPVPEPYGVGQLRALLDPQGAAPVAAGAAL